MQSVMQHDFARNPTVSIPRSTFNRSHSHKTTFDAGYLVPILVDEYLPGDSINLRISAMCRLTPTALDRPIMDNLYLDIHAWSVDNRLLMTNWPRLMGEQATPTASIDFTVPQVVAPAVTGVQLGELYDYMGVPTEVASLPFNNLHGRASNLIWNTAYRDQNIQDSLVVDLDDGPDTYSDYSPLRRRGKRFDYFTSCLPEPQKGDPVELPLGSTATVRTINSGLVTGAQAGMIIRGSAAGAFPAGNRTLSTNSSGDALYNDAVPGANPLGWYPANLYADLSTATGPSINDMRVAVTMQQFLERDARSGTRYPESIFGHFGVVTPSARWRPEYLGGGTFPVNIHPVPGTNQDATAAASPGQLSAFGTASTNGISIVKSFTEHGVILIYCSLRADLTYQQGLNKMFSRRTRYDFFFPDFQNIGEQPVLTQEIYCTMTATDDDVFGYLPYGESYRTKPSQITGLFRSNATGTLDVFHLSQIFTSAPTLSPGFIQDDPPVDRVIAVPTEPHVLGDFYFNYICARPLPVNSIPGLDKF